ncbi:MAG: HD domain-containing protein, partial [Thermodesulfobacteriota bacterium]|nr:HD domain-containing protein [Thermodesulfobacteriota bacterium]
LVKKIVYPLWDIGLDVGYAARSIKESLHIAGKDIEALTSLLDARFICGNSHLFLDLMEHLRKKVILKESDKIIGSIVENNTNRHKRFGDSTYLLEPNLKVGRGGLRDYHTMLWIARTTSNISRPRDLEFYGYLSHEEFHTLKKSLSFIWNVRNRLHNLTGRKCDQLHFEYQTDLACALKYNAKNGQQPVERFLGDLHSNMEFIKELHMMFLYEHGYATKYQPNTKQIKHAWIDGFEVIKDRLSFSSPEKILQSPDLLIKIFEESAVLKVPLSHEAKRFVKEFAYLVDDEYRASPSAVKSFEKILITPAPTFNVLNEMFNTGFLVHFIPELKAIVNRIQYNEYHIYPVDKHLLRTVQIIKNFGTPEDTSKDRLYGELYNKLTNRKILLWAALLHDIGKKDPAKNHSQKGAKTARSILSVRGYKSEEIETVSFLIEEHLSMIKTATRRDINDEETAISFARKVKDKERLKMLYLLTIADSMATGPKAWSVWTSTLLKDLFLKVLHILEKGELATEEAVRAVEKKKEEVLNSTPSSNDRQTTETLFNFMSPRYLLYTTAQDILEHIRLYKSLGNSDFV